MEVQIDVVDRSNKPPVWDQTVYGPIYVKENTAIGETVTTVKARSVLCVLLLSPKEKRKAGSGFFVATFCALRCFCECMTQKKPDPVLLRLDC